MHLAKVLGIILICCLVDGLARSLIPGWGSPDRAKIGLAVAYWLYYTWLILGVGDIFCYLFFAFTFEVIYSRFQHKQSAEIAMFTGLSIALGCFLLFGWIRFYTAEQLTLMAFAYGIIGSLYGYLHHKWIIPYVTEER